MGLLREKQSQFVFMLAQLISFAYQYGYEITLGDGLRKDGKGHMKNSLHYLGLAQDLNLFKDGVFLQDSLNHAPLGAYWESLGGSWGGRFGDGNHYAVEFQGRK